MFDLEKLNLNLSYPAFLFIIGIIAALLYAYYVYRYTLPPVSSSKRLLLAFLRGTAIILLLFIFFEPILSMTKKVVTEPVNLIFIDNSRSILIKDNTDREGTIISVAEKLNNNHSAIKAEFFLFGNQVESLQSEIRNQLDFSHTTTNFSKIFNSIESGRRNIASITIISDGVITDGSNPIYTAQQTAVPVFTVGIGDSSRKNDLEVKSVLYNDLIYAETPTTIMTTIVNTGFSGQNVMVTLFENDVQIEQKSIILNEGGANTINFDYTPKSSGEKKLTISVSELKDESTYANNKKIFFVNVLSNKINVLILSGSPSADLTFVRNALSFDNNISVSTLTQIRSNQFIEGNYTSKIDSADIFFMIGFPTKDTPAEAFNQIVKKISERNTPFFFTLNSDIDITKLGNLQPFLPFTLSQMDNIYQQVQPEIQVNETNNPLVQHSSGNPVAAWNNLPPVLQSRIVVNPKPESKIISRIKTDNIPRTTPLLLTRSIGNKRSISLLAKDFWRWKLQTAVRGSDLFDSFIINSVRWLNVSDEYKKVKINSLKRVFASGEEIEFSGRVYDDAMNPVNNADVKLSISGAGDRYEINLSSVGGGLYEGKISLRNPGDYSFYGEAKLNGNLLGEDKGIFNIGEIDIEMINPRMDYEFLNLLALETGGEYFDPSETDELINVLNKLSSNAINEKFVTSEISVWSNEWLLMLTILIFAIEWFIRKRSGML